MIYIYIIIYHNNILSKLGILSVQLNILSFLNNCLLFLIFLVFYVLISRGVCTFCWQTWLRKETHAGCCHRPVIQLPRKLRQKDCISKARLDNLVTSHLKE